MSGVGRDLLAKRPLHERVLVFLAERLGPTLDVLDVTNHDGWSVRDMIEHFGQESPFASPAEVRAALHDLHDAELVYSCGLDARVDGEGTRGFRPAVMKAESAVRITCRGLVAARAIVPACGRPLHCVTLRTRRAKPLLDIELITGNGDRDRLLNASATCVGVALVILSRGPSVESPLIVDDLPALLDRLAVHGAPRRPGPKADQPTKVGAIRQALRILEKTLNVTRGYLDEDRRRDYYFLLVVLLRAAGVDGKTYAAASLDLEAARRVVSGVRKIVGPALPPLSGEHKLRLEQLMREGRMGSQSGEPPESA